MQARIGEIPAKENATWGAVFATLMREHREDWKFHWTAHRELPQPSSYIEIEAPGEDVDGLRAEIGAIVDLVNSVAKRDPLDQMAQIDPGLVDVLVD
jgi:hypothetical protein